MEGYDVSVSGSAEDGFVIVNSEQEEPQPGDGTLVLSKEWDDESDESRPDTLTFTVVSETEFHRILDVIEVDAETGEVLAVTYQHLDDDDQPLSDWIEGVLIEGLAFDYEQ